MSSSGRQEKSSKIRSLAPRVLITAGALLLGYVSYEYGNMLLQQRRLAHAWNAEQQRVEISRPSLRGAAAGLIRISAPEIGLDAIVVEGSDSNALALGPGHMENTAFPGQRGNAVIVAHRDTFFRRLYELQPGDHLNLQQGGQNFTYVVTGKKIVDDTDISVIKAGSGYDLTLITCYPEYYIGPAPQRLVVSAELAQKQAPQRHASLVAEKGKRPMKAKTIAHSVGAHSF